MGEAKRRQQAGGYPEVETFEPGVVTVEVERGESTVRLTCYVDRGGAVYLMHRGRRVRRDDIVRAVQDAARKREGRIVRPVGGELIERPGR